MSTEELQIPEHVQACLFLAIEVQLAMEESNEPRALEAATALMAVSFEDLAAFAGPEELEARCFIHGVISQFLVEFVFADDSRSTFWETITMPHKNGLLTSPSWIGNIKWARLFGSTIPDVPELLPSDLQHGSLRQQAKALGRYCSTHDSSTPLDLAGLVAHIQPRLMPYFISWVTGTYLQSPSKVESAEEQANKRHALEQLIAHMDSCELPLESSLAEINTPFQLSYRDGFPIKQAAELINGRLTRQLADNGRKNGRTGDSDSIRNQLEGLSNHDSALLCPNWRDSHVAYRCLGDMTRSMQEAGDPAILIHGAGSRLKGQTAEDWNDQSMEVNLPGKSGAIFELGQVADAIRDAELDFLFYPEVTPSNSTALLATQRLARVQAAGYGFPITTGSPHMDYFIGGTDVENQGEEYSEQLVVLPGLGVSTKTPPGSSMMRERPYDDERVRIMTLASDHKLNAGMLEAWEAILCDKPLALLDLFPGLTLQQTDQYLPNMARYLVKSAVDLHPKVQRSVIVDTLVDADLYLDSFPFGGFNSLVEVLVAGCPVVTLEGSTARQRFGAAMLRRLGLPEFLIAKNPKEYIAASRRLIDDASLRMDIRAQIGDREHVLAALNDKDIPHHFAAAVEWMRNAGPLQRSKGGKRAPIIIAAGDKPRALCA